MMNPLYSMKIKLLWQRQSNSYVIIGTSKTTITTEKTRHVWITIGTVVSFLVFRNTPISPLLDRIYMKQKVQFPELHISKLPQSFLMYLFIKGKSFEVVGGHRFFLLWSLYVIESDIQKFTFFSHPQP